METINDLLKKFQNKKREKKEILKELDEIEFKINKFRRENESNCIICGNNLTFEKRTKYCSDECAKKGVYISIKKWKRKHPDKIKKYNKDYNNKHPEDRNKRIKKWMKIHKEKFLFYKRNWQRENPDKIKKYKETHKKKLKNIKTLIN